MTIKKFDYEKAYYLFKKIRCTEEKIIESFSKCGIDFKTYLNIVTAGVLDGAKLPIVADTDRDAIGIGIRGCPGVASETAKMVRIKNTLELTDVWASEPMLQEIESNPRLEISSGPFECKFDNEGALMGAI